MSMFLQYSQIFYVIFTFATDEVIHKFFYLFKSVLSGWLENGCITYLYKHMHVWTSLVLKHYSVIVMKRFKAIKNGLCFLFKVFISS